MFKVEISLNACVNSFSFAYHLSEAFPRKTRPNTGIYSGWDAAHTPLHLGQFRVANLPTDIFLVGGRKSETSEGTHMDLGRTHKTPHVLFIIYILFL